MFTYLPYPTEHARLPKWRRHCPHESLLVASAARYARHAHAGERFNYVSGYYYQHVQSVADRMHTRLQKATALLHDVPESVAAKVRKRCALTGRAFTPQDEEKLIAKELARIGAWLGRTGCNVQPILDDLNVLTKRSAGHENDTPGMRAAAYHAYIGRIITHARTTGRNTVIILKLADIDYNLRVDRNPPPELQSDKDRARLGAYETELARLKEEFPGIRPRSLFNVHAVTYTLRAADPQHPADKNKTEIAAGNPQTQPDPVFATLPLAKPPLAALPMPPHERAKPAAQNGCSLECV